MKMAGQEMLFSAQDVTINARVNTELFRPPPELARASKCDARDCGGF
jgi:hypothetical protein